MPPGGRQILPGSPASIVELWYHEFAALLQTGGREKVNAAENLIEFLVAVGASIVGSYVGKWLDRHRKGRQAQRKTGGRHPSGFCLRVCRGPN